MTKAGHECADNAHEADMGAAESVEACYEKCTMQDGCKSFIYGYGDKANQCWSEGPGITRETCTTWSVDSYNFYEINGPAGTSDAGAGSVGLMETLHSDAVEDLLRDAIEEDVDEINLPADSSKDASLRRLLVQVPPSVSPTTAQPTDGPSATPTKGPSVMPSVSPTSNPTQHPTLVPTDSAPKHPTAFPTSYGPIIFVKMASGHECANNHAEVDLGDAASVQECAQKCDNVWWCTSFIYGHGNKAGSCWNEGISFKSCTEWEEDEYDFYTMSASAFDEQFVMTKAGHECADNAHEADMGAAESVEACYEKCTMQDGCKSFVYGYGDKANQCWSEGPGITRETCTTWGADSYNFYEINGPAGTSDAGAGSVGLMETFHSDAIENLLRDAIEEDVDEINLPAESSKDASLRRLLVQEHPTAFPTSYGPIKFVKMASGHEC